jgi:hypothetical protein
MDSSVISVVIDSTTFDSLICYSVVHRSDSGYSITMEIETIKDNHFLRDCYYMCGNRGVLKQRLIFKQGDSVLADLEPPLVKEEGLERIFQGKRIKLSYWVYSHLLYRQTPVGMLYILNGSGMSNASREASVYYSQKGEFLGLLDCGRPSCDTVGNIDLLYLRYGITDNTRSKALTLFPPQLAGQVK